MIAIRVLVLSATLLVLGGSTASAATGQTPMCGYLFDGAIVRCVYPDMSVSARNVSFSVIDVEPVFNSTNMRLDPSTSSSLTDVAVQVAVPSGLCVSVCRLLPGRRMIAWDSTNPAWLRFRYNLSASVSRNAAITLVGMLENKFRSPGQRLGSQAGECASAIGKLPSTPSDWGYAFRQAITFSSACSGVVSALRESPGQEAQVGKSAVGWAKSLYRGIWIDEMISLAGKIARR